MELTDNQLAEVVRMNLENVVSVDDPAAIDAFNFGKQIFDVSAKAKKLDLFVAAHNLRNRIAYNRTMPLGDWAYPFERFWDRPVYLIHDRNSALPAGNALPS